MAKSRANPKTKSKTKQLDDEDELQVKSRVDDGDDAAQTELDDSEAVDADIEDAEEEAVDVKARVADEDIDDEVDVDVDVDEADSEVEAEADADDTDDGDDADIDADQADDDDGDEESVDEGPTAPPAKITKLAIFLILMNWIAAPGFLVLAFMDHSVRVQYAHRSLLNYLQIWGLPLEDEDKAASLSMDTRPRLKLTAEQVKEVANKRIRKSYTDYAPVDELVPLRIRPRDMTDALLTDVFDYQGVEKPVPTLDAEIRRLKEVLPSDITAAAAEVLAAQNTDEEKRAVVVKSLFSIAWDVWQAKRLDDTLTKAKGADLDNLVTDSVQRRIYYDILAPLNVFRPGDIKDAKNYKIEKLSDQTYTLDQVKGFLLERLDAALADEYKADTHIGDAFISEKQTSKDPQSKQELSSLTRGSVEKRQKIGFLLFTLGHVSVPALDKKLYPKGIERAQVVSGLYEFTSSSVRYVQTLQVLETRIVEAIKADRGGYMLAGDKGSTAGFAAEYELEIDRLVKLVEHIDAAQKRLDDLRGQKDQFQKIYDQRAQQHKDALAKLLLARADTERYAKDLRKLQQQLHTALVELSDAGERNFRLLDEITAIEKALQKRPGKKGGQK